MSNSSRHLSTPNPKPMSSPQATHFSPRFASPFRRQYRRGGYHCYLCDCRVGWTEGDAKTHESGKKHKKRLLKIDDVKFFDCSSGYCELCHNNLAFGYRPGDRTRKKHVNGRKHRHRWMVFESKLLQEMQLLRTEATVDSLIPSLAEETILRIVQFAGLPAYHQS